MEWSHCTEWNGTTEWNGMKGIEPDERQHRQPGTSLQVKHNMLATIPSKRKMCSHMEMWEPEQNSLHTHVPTAGALFNQISGSINSLSKNVSAIWSRYLYVLHCFCIAIEKDWGKRKRGEERGREERGRGYTFDLEVLCHETCYVYAAVSRLQEERHCPTQPLLGNYHYIMMTSSHTSE